MSEYRTDMEDCGGAAFPLSGDGRWGTGSDGMSLRDYFAAKAMQGMYASGNRIARDTPQKIAKDAYEQADALLAARERKLK